MYDGFIVNIMLNKLEKTWTQEGGLDGLYKGSGCLLSGVSYLYSSMAARPG